MAIYKRDITNSKEVIRTPFKYHILMNMELNRDITNLDLKQKKQQMNTNVKSKMSLLTKAKSKKRYPVR